jgi:ankyrin repeat protein
MEAGLSNQRKWTGLVGAALGSSLYVDFSSAFDDNNLLDDKIKELISAISKKLPKYAEINVSQAIMSPESFAVACRQGSLDALLSIPTNLVDEIMKNKSCVTTGFIDACLNGHLRVVEWLVNKGHDINCRGFSGMTALMSSCHAGLLDVVTQLLQFGCDINLQDDYGNTALIYGCMANNAEIVERVLSKGANVHIKNKFEDNGSIYSCSKGYVEIVQLLLNYDCDLPIGDDGKNCFFAAAEMGHANVIRLLLMAGVDLFSQNEVFNRLGFNGFTIACKEGRQEVVRLLLDKGLDVNAQCTFGDTGLMLAAATGDHEMLRLLLERQCDVFLPNSTGKTVFDVCKDRNTKKELLRCLELDDSFVSKSSDYISDYLLERQTKSTTVRRIRLLLVGNGRAGKTTMAHRLKFKEYLSVNNRTDGIEMMDVVLGEENPVTFTLLDFAGQKEYAHTHRLFFNDKSLFCVLHNPISSHGMRTNDNSLDEFLAMIANTAPNADVVFVTTHCKEPGANVDPAYFQLLQSTYNINIRCVIAVDSVDGTGYDTLERELVAAALKKDCTTKIIPYSYVQVQQEIDRLSSLQFSIDEEAFYRRTTDKFQIRNSVIRDAIEQFSQSGWGNIHILSNRQLCLRPQQLANVMSSIFTINEVKLSKHLRTSLSQGVLLHDNELFRLIWGNGDEYDPALYELVDNDSIPTFLSLLYEANLAFRVYSEDGPCRCSLLPALLPSLPEDTSTDSLYSSYKDPALSAVVDVGTVVITISPFIPSPFFPQLQVLIRDYFTIGGNYQQASMVTDKKGNFCMLHCKDKHRLEIHTKAVSRDATGILFIVLSKLMTLLQEFEALSVTDVEYHFDGKVYTKQVMMDRFNKDNKASLDHVGSGISVPKNELVKLNLQPLAKMLGVSIYIDQTSLNVYSHGNGNQQSKFLQEIETLLVTCEEEANYMDLCIELFQNSFLKNILRELGLEFRAAGPGLRTLWLLLQNVTSKAVFCAPMTPCDVSYDSIKFLDERSFVEISNLGDATIDPHDPCVAVIQAILDKLYINTPEMFTVFPLRNISQSDKTVVRKLLDSQRQHFHVENKVPLLAKAITNDAKSMLVFESTDLSIRPAQYSESFDIFFSHPWNDKPLLYELKAQLVAAGYRVWWDQDPGCMGHRIQLSMEEGVEHSKVVLVALDTLYTTRENCMKELNHAVEKQKPVVTLLLEASWREWASVNTTYGDASKLCNLDALRFIDISDLCCKLKPKPVSDVLLAAFRLEFVWDIFSPTIVEIVQEKVKELKALLQHHHLGCHPSNPPST